MAGGGGDDPARGPAPGAPAALARRGGAASTVVFASAAVGLPPFYGVSLASGVLGMRLPIFLVSGSAGRCVRFAFLAWLGHHLGPAAVGMFADAATAFGTGAWS